MKRNYVLFAALFALVCCKKEETPTPPPDYGKPHKIALGVAVQTASTPADGIKSVSITYTGAHGEFTYDTTYSDSAGKQFPLTWDTTFTAYAGGEIKYTVGVNSYNLKMYSYDDYSKADTTFLVAEPDKVNMLSFKVND